jgi:hypothetical protein
MKCANALNAIDTDAPSAETMIPARLAPAASASDEAICILALPSAICSRGTSAGKNAT